MSAIQETDIEIEAYQALLDFLQEDVKVNDRVDASFHFLKYHDCNDREEDFLQVLKSNLVYYCFSKARYKNKKPHEICSLVFEGRDKFFNPKSTPSTETRKGRSGASRSGELGEIALYFLLESFLKAPQVVSKMALKTTQGENYKGSDGIHIGRYHNKNCIFYCESKLNRSRTEAFSDSIQSVLDFQDEKKRFEVSIVNNHIDIEDVELKNAVIEFLDPTKNKSDDWVEIHACFIGYNWDKFNEIEKEATNDALIKRLRLELTEELKGAKQVLQEKLKEGENKIRYYFFVMPFKDIEALRKSFLTLLYGTTK